MDELVLCDAIVVQQIFGRHRCEIVQHRFSTFRIVCVRLHQHFDDVIVAGPVNAQQHKGGHGQFGPVAFIVFGLGNHVKHSFHEGHQGGVQVRVRILFAVHTVGKEIYNFQCDELNVTAERYQRQLGRLQDPIQEGRLNNYHLKTEGN